MQAPDLAVAEIERLAGDNRFVSVLVLAQGDMLLGKRHFWPVYQAAVKHKLPIAIHAGSQYRGAPSSIGWPSYRYEYYLMESWARVKASLEKMDRIGLMALIHDLGMVTVYLRARNLVPPSTK